jgi:hypothetical protein
MSKITIPLLMIFAAVGFIALAKLDRDGEAEPQHRWPAMSAYPEQVEASDLELEPEPIRIEKRLSRAEFGRITDRELANIRLLPIAGDAHPVSFLWPTDKNDAPANPELLEFAQRDSFENWKSYSDEHIGFYYPDFPGVRVEVVGATDPLPLIAPTMVPPESSSFIKYRITAGDTGTLCVLTLAHTDEFDDAQRAPHPEIFHRFTPCGGGLLRTSFTASGQVRRAELLGKSVRVSLLDWPHLAIHQDPYLRIATSIQLARPYAKLRNLRQAAVKKYGLEGKLGFLDHGVSESEIISIVGQPAARDPERGIFEYFRSRDGEDFYYTLAVQNGMFAGFGKDWREVSRNAPSEGSVRWMFEKTDYRVGEAGGAGYNLGALTDADAQNVFDRFVELGPTAGSEDWGLLCGAIANLAQHGLDDQRVVEIARVKLDSPDLDPDPALLALEACNSDFAKAAIAEHIIANFASAELEPATLEHFYTLIAYLGKSYPASAQLIDRALSHQSVSVRELGFKYCSWLPEKFATPHLEAGLQDASTEVRRSCASAFAEGLGDPARHPKLLSMCLSQESDEEVKLLLQEALQRFGETPGT